MAQATYLIQYRTWEFPLHLHISNSKFGCYKDRYEDVNHREGLGYFREENLHILVLVQLISLMIENDHKF